MSTTSLSLTTPARLSAPWPAALWPLLLTPYALFCPASCHTRLHTCELQKGPEIRTGNTEGDQDLPISAGDEIIVTTDEAYATKCDNKTM